MAYKKVIENTDILIEYSSKNGHIRLIKEGYKYFDKCNLKINRDIFPQLKVQYSTNGNIWSTCAKYKYSATSASSKYFHELVASLKNGTKLQFARNINKLKINI